jgi:dihydrofolate reductase
VPLRAGFQAVTGLQQLQATDPGEDIWVVGGATVYRETIGAADELLLTQVLQDFKCTKFFPPYQADFELGSQSADHLDGDVTYRFETWRSRTPDREASS